MSSWIINKFIIYKCWSKLEVICLLFWFHLPLLFVWDRVLSSGTWAWSSRYFVLIVRVVFEVLVDATGRYDATSYAAQASTGQTRSITRQVACYIFIEVLISGPMWMVVQRRTDHVVHYRISIVILIDWVESRPTSRHWKQANWLALSYLIINIRNA